MNRGVVPGLSTPDAAPVVGGAPLTFINYAAGADGQTFSTTSATDVDVDAVNAAVTFIAPASGNVVVSVCMAISGNTSIGAAYISLREGSTVVASRYALNVNILLSSALRFRITGLVPGSSHTYKLGWHTSAGTFGIYTGPTNGALLMEVFAV